jgi:hypothetical protein
MSKIGYGYGSEWHLLRYLGYHRERLDQAVMKLTRATGVKWLDSEFAPQRTFLDAEWKGVEFLPTNSPARKEWRSFWGTRGNPPNWDAVGRIEVAGIEEWLLVEAKGHPAELKNSCKAKPEGGRDTIARALAKTKEKLGIDESCDWLGPYYQLANRLAVLCFLNSHGIPARLLNIYFTGDSNHGNRCPDDEPKWKPHIQAMHKCLGLAGNSEIERNRVHNLFLPVCENGRSHSLTRTTVWTVKKLKSIDDG